MARGMAQMIEHLLSKLKALSSTLSIVKKKKVSKRILGQTYDK
jgi:hypothetical protein